LVLKAPLHISSADNSRLKQLRGLLEQANLRRKTGLMVLEGIHLLDAYQKTNQVPQYICTTEATLAHPEVITLLNGWSDVLVVVVPEALYKDMRTLGPGLDLMAVAEQPICTLAEQWLDDVLILEAVQDAGNVGTLLRTAAAAGIKHVLCTTGTASVWSPRVLRAGMGAQFGLSIHEHLDIHDILPKLSIPLYVTSSHVSTSLYGLDLSQPVAWLMGNEGQGASQTALAHAQAITIPQPGGQESLNVAIAGAICMFEMVRQRLSTSQH
jgi:TrmH family RNA methyltransferase